MATADLLQAETRDRPRVAVAAALAAIFTLGAPIVAGIVLADAPDNLPGATLFRHDHQAGSALGTAASVLGLLAVVVVLDFLYRAVRARNPAFPVQLRPLAWIGGLGLAALSIGIQIASVSKLGHFATDSTLTYDEAKAASDFGPVVLLGVAAQLAFAFAIVMISINAMRVGLLTRFLGYLGVISAVLFVLAFLPIPIVQVYWLGALATLFLGRLPSGTPPAWTTGQAEPWPTPAEMREARVREAEERRGEGSGGGDDVDATVETAAVDGPSRRKRKKRR